MNLLIDFPDSFHRWKNYVMSYKNSEFISIGEILAPLGLKGKMKVNVLTDFPERFSPGETVYIEGKHFVVESAEWQKGNAIIKLEGIDDVDPVEKLTGKYLEISLTQLHKLAKGQYYHHQIIGLKVITTAGKLLGTISSIMTTSGTDIYTVKSDDSEILIPATADVIKSIDIDKKEMVIEAIAGLLELNQKTDKPKPEKSPKKYKPSQNN